MAQRDAPFGETGRFDVTSTDGTSVAVWTVGTGPPVVLVHGALSDHTRFDPLVEDLAAHVTACSMDRRGRGASGDATGYAITHEFDDVAAVVEAVAERTGSRVALFGHSYGANCAMGGAARSKNVSRLVLYEPGLSTAYPPGSLEALEAAAAGGDRETAVVTLLRDVLGATDEEIDGMRAGPLWAARLATVPTVPRELRTEDDWVYEPGQFDAITAPTLVLAGSESPPIQQDATDASVAAIPGAQVRVLEGHGHFAIQTDPALVAKILLEFIGS